MKFLKSKSGFTLVELIVIFALAAVVLTPLTFIMTSSLKNEVRIQRIIDSDQSMQQTFIILNEVVRNRGYNKISLVDSDSKLIVDNYTFYLDGNEFKYQRFDDTGNLINIHIMNTDIHSVTYTLADGSLKIEFEVDRENDAVVDEYFTYQYSKRE